MSDFERKIERFIEFFIEYDGYKTVIEGLQNTLKIASASQAARVQYKKEIDYVKKNYTHR